MKIKSNHPNYSLDALYGHLSDCVIVGDTNRIITYMNSAAIEKIGKIFDLHIGKTSLNKIKFQSNDSQKTLTKILDIYLKGIDHTSIILNAKKTKINCLFTLDLKFLFHTDSKKPSDYILLLKEYSNIDEINSKLIESNLKYKGLFENAQEGIFILDNEGFIINFNPSACRVYGIKDFKGMKIFDVFPHNSPSENKTIWNNFMKNGSIKGFYKYQLPNGKISFIDFKARTNYLPNLNLAVLTDETEKRKTEIALLKSESNLKSIFENSLQGIILLDANHKILASNTNANSITYTFVNKKIKIGADILSCCINKKFFLSEFNKAMTGVKIISERNYIDENGSENWLEFTYYPIKNAHDKVIKVNYSIENITNRKFEALKIIENEQKFRSLSENSPDIIYIIDIKKEKVTYLNKNSIFGYSSIFLSEFESWLKIIAIEDTLSVKEHWTRFLKSKKQLTESIEYRIQTLNGELEWVSNRHLVLEKDQNGRPLKVLQVLTIITDRKKFQDTIKQNESRLTALIENTNDLVWSVDSNFNLTTLNNSFKELIYHNYKKKISLGDNLYSSLPNISKDGWIALHVSALKGKKVTAEFSWYTVKGGALFFEISYNPIYNSQNYVIGVSVFARDITQRKTNEAIIVQTNFELDSFVYRASHDLRAPLRSIMGLVTIMNNETNEKTKIDYLKLIEKSAFKLDNFISDLINFSRSNRETIEIDLIDFTDIITESLETIQFMDGASKLKITTSIKGIQNFQSDAKRISIFINNLLSNAVKYQHPNKKPIVKILINATSSYTTITISDNGIGIKKEYLPKIFNMFYRASENSFGSGLGLYIAKQAVERIEGKIIVESKLGIGTTFKITLPNLEKK